MPKQLTFSEEARAAMKRGIDQMASTVGVTLGPRGRNVVLDKKFGPPQVCSCLLYTSPSPRDGLLSRMPSSA